MVAAGAVRERADAVRADPLLPARVVLERESPAVTETRIQAGLIVAGDDVLAAEPVASGVGVALVEVVQVLIGRWLIRVPGCDGR